MFRKDLENILKEKYAAQQSEIDHDALWSRVYPEIKKDRRRPFVLWISGFSVVIVGVILWMWLGLETSNTTITNSHALSGSNVELTEVKENLTEQKTLGEASLNKAVVNKIADRKEIDNTELQEIKNVIVSSEVENNIRVNHSNYISKTTISSKPINAAIQNVFTTNVISSNKSQKETIRSSLFNSETIEKALMKIEGIYLLNNLLDIPTKELVLDLSMPFIDPKKESVFQRNYSLDLMYGYGIVSGSLESLDADLILASRKATEESLDVISSDLLINYHISSHWTVSSGLDYQLITDRTTHSFKRSEVVSGDSVLIEIIEDSNGSFNNIYGSGEELEITSTVKTRYNYYQTFGIPIELVCNNSLGSLRYELGAGLRFTKLFSATGFIQEHENTEYDISTDVDNLFGRAINSELLLDAGIVYSISPRLGWRSALQFRYGLDGINSTQNPISQKYNLIKITTGLRYQF